MKSRTTTVIKYLGQVYRALELCKDSGADRQHSRMPLLMWGEPGSGGGKWGRLISPAPSFLKPKPLSSLPSSSGTCILLQTRYASSLSTTDTHIHPSLVWFSCVKTKGFAELQPCAVLCICSYFFPVAGEISPFVGWTGNRYDLVYPGRLSP